VDLDRLVGDLAGHLGAEQLGDRGSDPAVLARVVLTGAVADQGLAGGHARGHVGQVGLDQLEAADRHPALVGAGRVRHRLVQGPARGAHREGGDVHAPAGE
jgi:hypothetical protein